MLFHITDFAMFRRWVAYKATEKTNYLRMIFLGMLASQTRKGVDTAETNRKRFAAEHFRALLITLVPQTSP